MLVIERKLSQQVKIGDAVVTVLKVHDGKVRLGIAAPPSVPIVRDDAKKGVPNATA